MRAVEYNALFSAVLLGMEKNAYGTYRFHSELSPLSEESVKTLEKCRSLPAHRKASIGKAIYEPIASLWREAAHPDALAIPADIAWEEFLDESVDLLSATAYYTMFSDKAWTLGELVFGA